MSTGTALSRKTAGAVPKYKVKKILWMRKKAGGTA